ncbi:MAG: DUF3987 domain-containing protein, partial [Longimicrobiales bacterium]
MTTRPVLMASAEARADGAWPDCPQLPGPPDPNPVPVDVLPPVLRAQVESVAGATQTPPDMGVLLTLAVVSAALRGRAEVLVDANRGWREMAVIYTAVVMPPAARKSPVYAHLTAPLYAWEREALERTGPDYRRALDRVEVARAAMTHVRGAAARGKGTASAVAHARS